MKRLWFGFAALVVAAFSAGCGDNGGGSAGSAGTAGTAGSAGTAGAAGSTAGSNTGGSSAGGTGGVSTSSSGGTGGVSTSSSGGTGGVSTGGTGGAAGGATCGGFAGLQCASNEFCDFPDDLCGAADGSGTCQPRPDVCPDNVDPVCTCDGKIYNNACEGQAAGADIASLGGCQAPAGQFPCGPKFCAKGQQYCEVDVSDVAGVPNGYGCQPLPGACSQPGAGCNCLANVPCGNMCSMADGGFTVTCPGG